jgi:hypothetical protein
VGAEPARAGASMGAKPLRDGAATTAAEQNPSCHELSGRGMVEKRDEDWVSCIFLIGSEKGHRSHTSMSQRGVNRLNAAAHDQAYSL